MQKALLLWHLPESAPLIRAALRSCERFDAERVLLGRRADARGG